MPDRLLIQIRKQILELFWAIPGNPRPLYWTCDSHYVTSGVKVAVFAIHHAHVILSHDFYLSIQRKVVFFGQSGIKNFPFGARPLC